jgi:hypothetical protein
MVIVRVFKLDVFTIVSDDTKRAILGLPYFSAYYITLDRSKFTIEFRLGCACDKAKDGYPKIIIGQGNGTKVISYIPTGLPSAASSTRYRIGKNKT